MFNQKVFEKINQTDTKLLLVTKYFDAAKTREILAEISQTPSGFPLLAGEGEGEVVLKNSYKFIIGFGENRINDILKKKIPRNFCHFIGNIQSRRIPEIAENCSVIHSLCNLKHAKLFAKTCISPLLAGEGEGEVDVKKPACRFFIQINVSGEESKSGILPENFAGFYESLPKELEIIGISGMGKGANFTRQEKIAEFKTLLKIREKFNSQWQISAGTSVDYEIALAMGIDIVRVGQAMFN